MVNLLDRVIPIQCKWVFKTKRDFKGNIDQYKVRIIVKVSLKKKESITMKTFSPISKRYSFRILIALVAHFDLELHQIDVKTTFLNGNLDEEIYIKQLKVLRK